MAFKVQVGPAVAGPVHLPVGLREQHRLSLMDGDLREAAETVRVRSAVASRKDLLPDTQAGNRWLLIESAYRAWKST
jgi:hypothetical protein